MKNIVIVHLESLSNGILKLNQDLFPNIIQWKKKMEEYTNYYSTATSTLMVMTDLFFEDTSLFEDSTYLHSLAKTKKSKKSLFDRLHEDGYHTHLLYYGLSENLRQVRENLQEILAEAGNAWYGDTDKELQNKLLEIIGSQEPFALFIEENASHISYTGERISKEKHSGYHIFRERYSILDKTVGLLFEILQQKDILENTLVLLYGDHGEEFWFHGLHEGYTHAIEPFTDMVNCPLLIYDGKNENKVNDSLVDTTDIGSIIKNKVGLNTKPVKKDYVISRNLFAKQIRLEKVFNKSYSITDGRYTLLLSKKGLALYINEMDMYNLCNILDFFVLQGEELVFRKECKKLISSHIKYFMTEEQQRETTEEFYMLREWLKNYINQLPDLQGKYSFRRINYTRGNTRWALRMRIFFDRLIMIIGDELRKRR